MGDFSKQVVVCLASDLEETAKAIAHKERSGRTSAILRFGQWTGGMPAKAMATNGKDYDLSGAKSRLVIVAHGDSQSRCINGKASLTGKTLAEFVSHLVQSPVDRVTLHICCGGGNESEGVRPSDSIACDFAKHAGGIAKEVTARTDVVAGTYEAKSLTGFKRTVGGRDTAQRKPHDKVIFFVDAGSSLHKPVQPQAFYSQRVVVNQ